MTLVVLGLIVPVMFLMTGCFGNNNNNETGGGETYQTPVVGTYGFMHFLFDGKIATMTDLIEWTVAEVIADMDPAEYADFELFVQSMGFSTVAEYLEFFMEPVLEGLLDATIEFDGYEAILTIEFDFMGIFTVELVSVFEFDAGEFTLVRAYEDGDLLTAEELAEIEDSITYADGQFTLKNIDPETGMIIEVVFALPTAA